MTTVSVIDIESITYISWTCAGCGLKGCRMKGAKPGVILGRDDEEIGLEFLVDFDFYCERCSEGRDIIEP